MEMFLNQSSKIFTFLDYTLWNILVYISLKYSDHLYGIYTSFEVCEAFVSTGKIGNKILLVFTDTFHISEIVILLKKRLSFHYHLIVQMNYILICTTPHMLGTDHKGEDKNGSSPGQT